MYNVKDKYLLLEIPKNGSRSLVTACCVHHGKNWMKCQGHGTFAEVMDNVLPNQVEQLRWPDNPVRTYAVFRNPVQRFHSQVHQAWRKKANLTLDDIMQVAWEQSDIVFKPQAEYVAPTDGDWEMDLRMWDMDRIHIAMSQIVGKIVYVRKNKNPGGCPITMDQILQHRLYDDIMETHYADDFKWWLRSQKTDPYGREP